MSVIPRILVGLAVVVGAISAAAAQAPAPATKPAGTAILDTAGYWRVHYTFRLPAITDGQQVTTRPTITGDTPLPPADWAKPDFNDRDWPRVSGFLFPDGMYNSPLELRNAGWNERECSSANLALLNLRGKFNVTDPAAVKDLKLSVSFRGGLAVYLNGKEIARSGLADAAGGMEALADEYPVEVFVKPDGTVLGGPYITKTFDEELLRRLRLRVRTREVAIPADKLQKGVNVLALEVHRAPYRPEMLDTTRKLELHLIGEALWSTCALLTARLENAGGGITPNVARPAGVQVWNASPIAPNFDVDYGDPNEPLGPVRLVGPRNGSVSGLVMVGSDKPIAGMKATLSELAGEKGGKIPASAVKVRFAQPNGWEATMPGTWTVQPQLLDGLADAAPAQVPVSKNDPVGPWSILPNQMPTKLGANTAVWITVEVPKDAVPGEYKAELSISAGAAEPVKVPVSLKVCPWQSPSPGEFRSMMDVIQSPESVALQYNVQPYSPEHFKLLEKSFDRLAYVGNWTVYIPLIALTNQGNEQTMVRWVKQADGTWKHDYEVMEKYLDLAIAHMGKPRITVLYVWDQHISGSKTHHQDDVRIPGLAVGTTDVPVTQLEDGKLSPLTLHYDEATKAAWKTMAEGVMERLKKRGLEKTAQIGLGSDARPLKDVALYIMDVFPNLPWARGGHYEWQEIGTSGGKLGLQDNVYPWKFVEDPAKGLFSCYGWNRPESRTLYVRMWEAAYPMTTTRLLPEMSVLGAQRGLGRIGLDFWPVLKPERPNQPPRNIQGRYPASNWSQLDAMVKALVPAGPDGAMASAHLEMLREGLQEAEARIFIESVLIDKTQRAKLGEDLAGRCRQALDERAVYFLPNLDHQQDSGFQIRIIPPYLLGWDNYAYSGVRAMIFTRFFQHTGWQARTEKLFTLADEVAQAVKN